MFHHFFLALLLLPTFFSQIVRGPQKQVNQIYLEYAPVQNEEEAKQQRQIGPAIDVLLNFNLKMCSTCQDLKYFSFKAGNNNVPTLKYATVSSSCFGPITFQSPSGPSGRPGNDQLFVATQIQDETWLLQPRSCLGSYLKALSSSSVGVQNGLSSSARFWIQYHDNHVHIQSATYSSSYWNGINPLLIGAGASSYVVQFWPSRAWP